MTRLRRALGLAALLSILSAVPAAAVPVTFNWTAGSFSGWYTFETSTPGARRSYANEPFDDWTAVFYAGAITGFGLEGGGLSVLGGAGDIYMALFSGPFGETIYNAEMRTGSWLVALNLWSPTGDRIINGEELTATAPSVGIGADPTVDGNIYEVTISDGATARDHRVDRVSPASAVSGGTTKVPESGSTLALLGLGFGAMVLFGRRQLA